MKGTVIASLSDIGQTSQDGTIYKVLLYDPFRTFIKKEEWTEGFKEDTIHDALTANPPPKGPPLVCLSAAFPAKTSPLQENEQGLLENVQDSSTKSSVSPKNSSCLAAPVGRARLTSWPCASTNLMACR